MLLHICYHNHNIGIRRENMLTIPQPTLLSCDDCGTVIDVDKLKNKRKTLQDDEFAILNYLKQDYEYTPFYYVCPNCSAQIPDLYDLQK